MNLTDLIYYVPQFLGANECDFLIDEYEKRKFEGTSEHSRHAITGIETISSFKRIILKENTEAFKIIHDATEKMINQYHDYLDKFNSFHTSQREVFLYSHMYRILKYEAGAKIHPHSDHSPFIYGSCTFNLNSGYTGGDFVFFNGRHRIKLQKGDAMIWPADLFWVHEVEEITSGVRYSTNSFIQSIPEQIKQELKHALGKIITKYNSNPKLYDKTRYKIRGTKN